MPYSFEITDMKQSCILLQSYSGAGLGSGSGASVLVFVVGRRFLNYFLKWPFVVAVESSKFLEMRSSVSPGKLVR